MIWLAGAGCLIFGIALCAIVVVRGKTMERLVALELTSVLTALSLLLIEQGLQRQSFYDVSLMFAILAFPSALVMMARAVACVRTGPNTMSTSAMKSAFSDAPQKGYCESATAAAISAGPTVAAGPT